MVMRVISLLIGLVAVALVAIAPRQWQPEPVALRPAQSRPEIVLPEFGGWAAAHLIKGKQAREHRPSEASPLQVRAMIFNEVYKWLDKKSKNKTVKITDALIANANKHELDPILVLAMIIQESGVRPNAKGRHGEIGLLQIKLPTAKWIAQKSGMKIPSKAELFKPEVNIAIGTAYLAFLRDELGHAYFIHAYNRGPTGMRRKKGDYLKRITVHYRKLVAALTVTDVHSFASLDKNVENTRATHPLVTLITAGQGKSTRVP